MYDLHFCNFEFFINKSPALLDNEISENVFCDTRHGRKNFPWNVHISIIITFVKCQESRLNSLSINVTKLIIRSCLNEFTLYNFVKFDIDFCDIIGILLAENTVAVKFHSCPWLCAGEIRDLFSLFNRISNNFEFALFIRKTKTTSNKDLSVHKALLKLRRRKIYDPNEMLLRSI